MKKSVNRTIMGSFEDGGVTTKNLGGKTVKEVRVGNRTGWIIFTDGSVISFHEQDYWSFHDCNDEALEPRYSEESPFTNWKNPIDDYTKVV